MTRKLNVKALISVVAVMALVGGCDQTEPNRDYTPAPEPKVSYEKVHAYGRKYTVRSYKNGAGSTTKEVKIYGKWRDCPSGDCVPVVKKHDTFWQRKAYTGAFFGNPAKDEEVHSH